MAPVAPICCPVVGPAVNTGGTLSWSRLIDEEMIAETLVQHRSAKRVDTGFDRYNALDGYPTN